MGFVFENHVNKVCVGDFRIVHYVISFSLKLSKIHKLGIKCFDKCSAGFTFKYYYVLEKV